MKMAGGSNKVTKHTRILGPDGIPAQSQFEENTIVQKHFAKTMHSNITDFEIVVEKELSQSYCGAQERFDGIITSDLIIAMPSPTQMRSGLLKRKKGKGHGENNITNGYLHDFAEDITYLEWPVYVKTYLRIQPPLQWKGGMACVLFKGKGSPALIENHRDIMLGNDNGKTFADRVRQNIIHLVRHISLSSQFGSGLNGGETSMAHVYIRSIIDLSKHANLSALSLIHI